jgi:CHASE3 domain sensor protein
MDENLSIFKKSLLLVGIPLLAQALFLGVLAKIRSDQADAQRWAIHTKDVMARAEGAYRLAVEANSDLRAYAVSADVDFDRSYHRDRQRIAPALLELRDLIQDNPTQQARLDVVRQKAEELVTWLDQVSALLAAGKREQALQRIDDLEGKDRVDAMRTSLDKFLEEERNLDLARQAGLAQAMREQNWALAGGCALAVASAGGLLFVFTRSIGRRLERLNENARRLGAGKELAAPLTGRDEIGRLDRVFHDMADALAQKERENEMFVYSVSHASASGWSIASRASGMARKRLTSSSAKGLMREVRRLSRRSCCSISRCRASMAWTCCGGSRRTRGRCGCRSSS